MDYIEALKTKKPVRFCFTSSEISARNEKQKRYRFEFCFIIPKNMANNEILLTCGHPGLTSVNALMFEIGFEQR